jgi:hypothetical protein
VDMSNGSLQRPGTAAEDKGRLRGVTAWPKPAPPDHGAPTNPGCGEFRRSIGIRMSSAPWPWSQGSFSIERMCQLAQVSRAGFYRSFEEQRPAEAEMEVRSAIQ